MRVRTTLDRLVLIISIALHLVIFCSGIVRQKTELTREYGKFKEFVHIAKTAGRSVKHTVKSMGSESPIDICHKHAVRVADVLARNSTAVVILRHPIERMESAFVFVRSGGFGQHIAPKHALTSFNSTDSLIKSLSRRTPKALSAIRCEAKMKYCSPAVNEKAGEVWDVMKHTSIEFRPQVWWINPPSNHSARDVRIVCFQDLHTVFPRLSKRRPARASLKGHFYLDREIKDATNRDVIEKKLYRQDTELYEKYCL